jgi:hypothetical protein
MNKAERQLNARPIKSLGLKKPGQLMDDYCTAIAALKFMHLGFEFEFYWTPDHY